jgi:hypothetical protein
MKTETKDQLRAKIENLESKLVEKDRDREELRLRFVEARKIYAQMEIEDAVKIGDKGEQYQTVHPDNANWMSGSDAYITVYTTGYDHNYDRTPKQRVCTIPIPDLTGGMRWNTKLPETYRSEERDEMGRYTFKVSPYWELVKENEYGQHWHHPEIETDIQMLVEQDFLIEDRDQFRRRQKQEHLEKMNHAIWLAGQIQEFYNGVGQFPDEEVEVQVRFALPGEVG